MSLITMVEISLCLPDGGEPGWFDTNDLDLAFADVHLTPAGELVTSRLVPPVSGLEGMSPGQALNRDGWSRDGQERVHKDGLVTFTSGDRIYSCMLDDGIVTDIRVGGPPA